MGWFSKKDETKKDEPNKAVNAPAPAPVAPAPAAPAPAAAAPAPRPAPTPPPAPTAPAPQPAAMAQNAPPRPSAAPTAPPQAPPAAQAGAPAQSAAAGPGGAAQPDTDPTRTFAALMRVALLAPQTQALSVQQLRTLVEPAIATGQFVVAANGQASAVVMWAMVSDEIDARARTELDKPFDIGPNDWRSGKHAWIAAVMGDTTTARSLVDMIWKGPLKGAPLYARMTTPEGEPGIATFSAEQPAQA